MSSNRITKHALVIGGGVAGLTSAICLREKGISVTVLTKSLAPDVTSVVAGALWEWPPAVCGYHHDQISLSRSKNWCMTSYWKFHELTSEPDAGVYIRPVTFYFRNQIEDQRDHLAKMLEIQDRVPGFVRDPDLIKQNEINQDIGLVDAYRHLAPMVDTDVYMAWLLKNVQCSGTKVILRKLNGLLPDQTDALKREFGADIIVNCAGLGAAELTGEYMYPLRGALIRLVNDGIGMPRLNEAHCVSHDEVTSDQEIVFIVPRGKNRIVLGALAEADQWSTDINLENHEPLRRMHDRCMEFMPSLRKLRIDPDEPVRVGLRPFRRQNVRLETDESQTIIHNYGHGGAGVTFSWGCALEVAITAEKILAL